MGLVFGPWGAEIWGSWWPQREGETPDSPIQGHSLHVGVVSRYLPDAAAETCDRGCSALRGVDRLVPWPWLGGAHRCEGPMAIPRVWGTTRCGSIVGASEVWGGGSCQLPAKRVLHFQLVHSGRCKSPGLPASLPQQMLSSSFSQEVFPWVPLLPLWLLCHRSLYLQMFSSPHPL